MRFIGVMRTSAARRQNGKGMFVLFEAGKRGTDFIRLMKRVICRMHERGSLPCQEQQARNQYNCPCAIHHPISSRFMEAFRSTRSPS
jgi:hypothetical protein